jgi:hypothetical protein
MRVSSSVNDLCLLKGKVSSNFSSLAFLGDLSHMACHSSFRTLLYWVLAALALLGNGFLSRGR